MLVELTDDLARAGKRLALAQPIGQVRDMIRSEAPADDRLSAYPSVKAAVDDLARS